MEGWISSWSIGFLTACARVSRRIWMFTTRLRGRRQVRSVSPRSKQEAHRRNSRTSPAVTGTTELAHRLPEQLAESLAGDTTSSRPLIRTNGLVMSDPLRQPPIRSSKRTRPCRSRVSPFRTSDRSVNQHSLISPLHIQPHLRTENIKSVVGNMFGPEREEKCGSSQSCV